VHRLVLFAFGAPERCGGRCARHLNGDPTDNRIQNLAWGTHRQNEADKKLHGTVARGESHGKTTLTERDVRAIRKKHRPHKHGYKRLAKEFGVDQTTIMNIIKGKTWGWLK
jgi:hypothetical protein